MVYGNPAERVEGMGHPSKFAVAATNDFPALHNISSIVPPTKSTAQAHLH